MKIEAQIIIWTEKQRQSPGNISLLLLLLLLSRFSRVRLCDLIDGSPPGSPVRGILQARTLEWAAISFSNAWKWKVKVKSLRRVRLLATPGTSAYQAPPSMGFSRQKYWSRVPLLSPGNISLTLNISTPETNLFVIWTEYFKWELLFYNKHEWMSLPKLKHLY